MSLKLPLRELRRNPNRFVVATVVLAFLSTLLLFLGGLLDGLYLGSTGAIRAQKADVIVYSSSARDSFLRSRITPDIRAQVEAADGVTDVGGIGFVLLGAQVPGETDLADVAVAGYELPPKGVPAPPADGLGVADSRPKDQGGSNGDPVLGGPAPVPDSSWFHDMDRPEWQPASSVFAPVWTLLYVLIATSMIILWHRTDGRERKHLFVLWGANLVLNLAWTVIFFRSHSPLAAGLEILLLEAKIGRAHV